MLNTKSEFILPAHIQLMWPCTLYITTCHSCKMFMHCRLGMSHINRISCTFNQERLFFAFNYVRKTFARFSGQSSCQCTTTDVKHSQFPQIYFFCIHLHCCMSDIKLKKLLSFILINVGISFCLDMDNTGDKKNNWDSNFLSHAYLKYYVLSLECI